jgi:hypothetical protein
MSSVAAICRMNMNAAFHCALKRRVQAAAKISIERPWEYRT